LVPLDLTKAETFVHALKDSYFEIVHGFYNQRDAQTDVLTGKLVFYQDQRDREEFAQLEDCVFERVVHLCPDLCFPAHDISESSELVVQYILPYAIARVRSLLPILDPFLKNQNRLIQVVLRDPSPNCMLLLDLFSEFFQPSKYLVGAFLNEFRAENLSGYLELYRDLKGLTSSEALNAAIDKLQASEFLAKLTQMGLPVFAAEEISWGELILRVKVAEDFSVDVDALDDSVRALSRDWQKIFCGGVRNVATLSATEHPGILVQNKWEGNATLHEVEVEEVAGGEGEEMEARDESGEEGGTREILASGVVGQWQSALMVLEEQQAALVKSKESKNEEKPDAREAEETVASPESFREGHLFVLTGMSERFYHVFGLELCGKPPSPNYYCTCARIRCICTCARIRLYLYVCAYLVLSVRVHVLF